jgi:hypothetical protein
MSIVESERLTESRAADGRWPPGVSGNPAGRPRGSRNRSGLALEAALAERAEEISNTVTKLAVLGNMQALRLCVQRLSAPVRQERIAFALPAIDCAADAARAQAAALQAVAAGELSAAEGAEVSRMIEAAARGFAAVDKAES